MQSARLGRIGTAALFGALALVGLAGCGPAAPAIPRAAPIPGCPPGRSKVDGVCTTAEVGEYLGCVRTRAAKLRADLAKKLAEPLRLAATRTSTVSEASADLEREVTEPVALEVVRECSDLRKEPSKTTACIEASKVGAACGFEMDPSWSAGCDMGALINCLTSRGPSCEGIALCGMEEGVRAACGTPVTPAGNAGCAGTLDCYQACKGEKACECRCTSVMSREAVLPVSTVLQCYEVKCRGCAERGRGECDACFRKGCQAKYDAMCKGR